MTVTARPPLPGNGSERDKELLCLHGNQRGEMGGGGGQRGGRGVKDREVAARSLKSVFKMPSLGALGPGAGGGMTWWWFVLLLFKLDSCQNK